MRLLKTRYLSLGKKTVPLLLQKGSNEAKVIETTFKVQVDLTLMTFDDKSKDLSTKSCQTKVLVIDSGTHAWHEHLQGLHVGSTVIVIASQEVIKDVLEQNDHQDETLNYVLKVTINKVKQNVVEEATASGDATERIQKYKGKMGKPVMPMPAVKTRPVLDEQPLGDHEPKSSNNGVDQKKVVFQPEPPAATRSVRGDQSSQPSANVDLVSMIITENRLQNTELRMSMMKMSDKMDLILASGLSKKEHSNLDLDLDNVELKKQIKEQKIRQDEMVQVQVRKVMNKVFKQLKSRMIQDGLEKSYTGQEVLDLLASNIKSTTDQLFDI
jgi:hypothetical protein